MQTKSGLLRTFEITSLVPGKPIPRDFCEAANEGGPWFFQPTWWNDKNYWGGLFLSQFTGHPICYSPGFHTEEDALEAAEAWEERLSESDELYKLRDPQEPGVQERRNQEREQTRALFGADSGLEASHRGS